jgi:hypothetical protein
MPNGGLPNAGKSGSEAGSGRDTSGGTPVGEDGAAGDAGGMPGAVGAGGGGSRDPEDVFDRSLGDFDGEITRERAGMASAGKGSGRGAVQRESGDARDVKMAGRGAGLPGDAGEMEGDGDAGASGGMAGAGGRSGQSGKSATEQPGGVASTSGEGGEGQAGDSNEGGGKGEPASGQADSDKAPDIPADIPADGTGEDQVARQIREAAMAEKDPKVRDALWEQYRRHTGIRK